MAVTISYEFPNGPGAPSAATMRHHSTMAASVTATADGDTDAVIVHNMALTAAQLADGQPFVCLEQLAAAARISQWIVTGKTANNITITKTVVAGGGAAGAQVRAVVSRPHTIIG